MRAPLGLGGSCHQGSEEGAEAAGVGGALSRVPAQAQCPLTAAPGRVSVVRRGGPGPPRGARARRRGARRGSGGGSLWDRGHCV